MTHPERKTKRADLEAVCRRLGLPLTVQRQAILEALAERDDHPTADQIFEAVRDRLPGLSRTTVYRVLDTLVRVGLAGKTCHPGTNVRFDPRTNRHHHLVCQLCERVIDLRAPALDALSLPSTRHEGFEISDYSIYFRGLCRECRSRQGDAGPRNGNGSPTSRGRRSPGAATRRRKGSRGRREGS